MNALERFDCVQGTPEWLACRAGIVTASEFDTVMASGKGGAPSKTRRTYMLKLIGERMTGEPAENYSNAHMARGHVLEPDARNLYAMLKDVEPEQVGFLRRGRAGCSPDSLIGEEGLLEIKTKLPHLQLELLLSGGLPAEHKAQVQGQLWVTGRTWCDFMSYWPGLPEHIVRVHRDEAYIAALSVAVRDFVEEMDELQGRIENMRMAA